MPTLPYAVLKRGDVQLVVVDNQAVDDNLLSHHRGGYSGAASLTHTGHPKNLFVPDYAGLNFEHIHDGTIKPREVLFEPRNSPLQLRVIDSSNVELYQPPTPHYGLESCLRYSLLEDGTIEMTFECIPRAATFANGYIGLFWASYIDQPESLDIHFQGTSATETARSNWIRGITPEHGVQATHLAVADQRQFAHDVDFPLTLVFNPSQHRYTEPWYFGVSHGMAFVQMFREQDQIRLTQSPNGGGRGNPAWDFQYFIPDYKVGQRYQMVMRAMYVPFESPAQLERLCAPHRARLSASGG